MDPRDKPEDDIFRAMTGLANTLIQIFPMRVALLNQVYLPYTWILLKRLFSLDSGRRTGHSVIPDEGMSLIGLGEARCDVVFMLPHTADEIVCDADIEGAIWFVRQKVDVEELLHIASMSPKSTSPQP